MVLVTLIPMVDGVGEGLVPRRAMEALMASLGHCAALNSEGPCFRFISNCE